MFCISPVHDQYFRHLIFLNIMSLSVLDSKTLNVLISVFHIRFLRHKSLVQIFSSFTDNVICCTVSWRLGCHQYDFRLPACYVLSSFRYRETRNVLEHHSGKLHIWYLAVCNKALQAFSHKPMQFCTKWCTSVSHKTCQHLGLCFLRLFQFTKYE
jgi:hypothetical protein